LTHSLQRCGVTLWRAWGFVFGVRNYGIQYGVLLTSLKALVFLYLLASRGWKAKLAESSVEAKFGTQSVTRVVPWLSRDDQRASGLD
jgi:hypothetical protein